MSGSSTPELAAVTAAPISIISTTVLTTVYPGNGVYAAGLTITNTGAIRAVPTAIDVKPGVNKANITNAGTVQATYGITFGTGGMVTNSGAGALISGGSFGIEFNNGAGTVVNQGQIIGGKYGVFLGDSGTITNGGTISGTTDAIAITNNGGSRLIVDEGAAFNGGVVVRGTMAAMEFAATTSGSTGTLNLGNSFSGFGTISFDLGSAWSVEGDKTEFDAGQTITGFGIGDTIITDTFVATSETFKTGTGLILTAAGGTTETLDVTGSFTTGNFAVTTNGVNTTIAAVRNVISTTVLHTVDPGNATYAANLTITSTGAIEPTATGSSGTNLSATDYVLNQGTIIGAAGAGATAAAGASAYAGQGGYGVSLSGGTLLNTGVISGGAGGNGSGPGNGYGGNGGGGIAISAGSLINTGQISGGAGGVDSNGYTINQGIGIYGVTNSAGGIITNEGTVQGYTGIFLENNGSIINSGTAALITGAGYGVSIYNAPAEVFNQGTITGGTGGALLHNGGYIANQGTSALIMGHYSDGIDATLAVTVVNHGTITGEGSTGVGIALHTGGTIINSGTISGHQAIFAIGNGNNTRLIVDQGAVFDGGVYVDGPGNLEFAATTKGSTGTLDLGSSFSGFETISFDAGSTWNVEGGAAEFDGAKLITGFTIGDTIILDGFVANPIDTTYVTGTGLELTSTGGLKITLDISEPAGAATGNFVVTDPPGDTTITYTACFAAGTRIRLADGRQIAVEHLRAGDRVELANGAADDVIWIGHRTIDLLKHPSPQTAQPICIAAGALGPHIPSRDLIVSPDHGMYLDGHLIPAKILLNGGNIRQLDRPRVAYYHIELASHAILFAEGAAAESYLDTGNRNAFENAGAVTILHPDFAQTRREAKSCAPFVESGAVVEAVRQRCLDAARIETTDDPALEITFANGNAYVTSRADVPGELTADPRDRRRLGVKIAALNIGGRRVPVDDALLVEGWHAAEADGRWTDGRAVIPGALLRGARDVTVELAATIQYRMPTAAKPHPVAWQ